MSIADVVVKAKHHNGEFVEEQVEVYVKCDFAEHLLPYLPFDHKNRVLRSWDTPQPGVAVAKTGRIVNAKRATLAEDVAQRIAREINHQADELRQLAKNQALKQVHTDLYAHIEKTRALKELDSRLATVERKLSLLYDELGCEDY